MENYISFTRNITLVAEKIVKKWIALKFLHMMSIKVKKKRYQRIKKPGIFPGFFMR